MSIGASWVTMDIWRSVKLIKMKAIATYLASKNLSRFLCARHSLGILSRRVKENFDLIFRGGVVLIETGTFTLKMRDKLVKMDKDMKIMAYRG